MKPPPTNHDIPPFAEGTKLTNPARNIMPTHVFSPWIDRKPKEEDDGVCAMLQSWLFAGRATLGTYAPPHNVWLGTVAEDPPRLERMEILQSIPVTVRFTSRDAIHGDLAAMDFNLAEWVMVADAYKPTESVFSVRKA